MTPVPLSCSFCSKTQHEVRKLIAGPSSFICDECITLCMGIINKGAAPYAVHVGPVSLYESAHLRIAAFAALKGWGSTGKDGQWKSWDWNARADKAEELVSWAVAVSERAADLMTAADLYDEPEEAPATGLAHAAVPQQTTEPHIP